MTHDEARELLALYASGGLEPDEEGLVSAHVSSCPVCQGDLSQYRHFLAEVDLGRIEPDWSSHAQMRQAFRTRLAAEEVPEPGYRTVDQGWPSRRPWVWPAAWAASVVLALAGWGLVYQTHQELSRSRQIVAAVTTGRPVALAAVHAARPDVTLYLAPAKAVVWVKKLPSLSPNQVYEGWWVIDGHPRPAGTFGLGPALLSRPKGATAFAITKEPLGGTSVPTTPILAASPL